MSRVRQTLLAITVAFLLVWITLAILVYPDLPARIPTHFGPSGRVDHDTARSWISWMLLPAVGGATTLFLQVVSSYAVRWPQLLNVPAKAELLALPEPLQRPLFEQVHTFIASISLLVLVLFASIHLDMWRIAVTGARALATGTQVALWLFLAVSVGSALWWNRHFARSVARATAQASRDAADPRVRPPRRAS